MPSHGQLHVEVFNDPMFQENGLLVWTEGAPDCWIVDPGLPPQPDDFVDRIRANRLTPAAILLTHCHADHIAGVAPLKAVFPDAPVLCPAGEVELLTSAEANLSASFGTPLAGPQPDRTLTTDDLLELGPLRWQCLDVAGHSPGALAYYCAEVAVALVGDAVFAEGIGRYDFPHSDRGRLLRNIRERLLTLPDQTTFYCGHGPETTVAHLKHGNAYLAWELSQGY